MTREQADFCMAHDWALAKVPTVDGWCVYARCDAGETARHQVYTESGYVPAHRFDDFRQARQWAGY